MTPTTTETMLDGTPAIELRAGALTATVVPGVGMVVASLRDGADELLGQRGGLAAYRERGSSFGVPLLYPWANRLSGLAYTVGDTQVVLDAATTPLRLDAAAPAAVDAVELQLVPAEQIGAVHLVAEERRDRDPRRQRPVRRLPH
jgi:hypothetical protein